MLIDVSHTPKTATVVRLPPEVSSVRYAKTDGYALTVTGDRRQLAYALREAGYTVVWDDPNPAVALGGRSSAKKAQTARENGTAHGGRKPSTVLVCPEPWRTTLRRLDKGTLIDLVYVACGDPGKVKAVMAKTVKAREAGEAHG